MKIETKCVQSGYDPKNGEPRVAPIALSTTFKYDSTESVGDLFDLKASGFFYTRLANPTVDAVEKKIAALEGGTAAVMVSSGQSATTLAILNICSAGDHVVASEELYGGTFNLFSVTLKRLGIDFTFVNINNKEQVEKAIQPNTKAIFAETIANPALSVIDFEMISKIAKKNHIMFIVDNTFATPYLCRPFELGADIIVHSTSKYLDGHAVALGGIIVDSGKFDFKGAGDKYLGFTEKDESYHGIVYSVDCKDAPFATKARVQLLRDLGNSPSPMNAFLLSLGVETLHLRMPRHSDNAQKIAEFLQAQKAVVSIKYPGLKSDPDFARAKKYLPNGASGVIGFDLGTREKAVKFMDSLKLAAIVVHVADVRTGVLHPASSTHRQLTDAQLLAAGITPGTIRLSVGIENVEDIIADLKQGLEKL